MILELSKGKVNIKEKMTSRYGMLEMLEEMQNIGLKEEELLSLQDLKENPESASPTTIKKVYIYGRILFKNFIESIEFEGKIITDKQEIVNFVDNPETTNDEDYGLLFVTVQEIYSKLNDKQVKVQEDIKKNGQL